MLAPVARLAAAPDLREHRRAGAAFGTTVSLLALHGDAGAAEQSLDAAFTEIRAVERAASLFDPQSDISRLNRDGRLAAPDARLLELLRLSHEAFRLTGGAFDITVQPYWPAWADAAAHGKAPTPEELAQARGKVDLAALVLDAHVATRAGAAARAGRHAWRPRHQEWPGRHHRRRAVPAPVVASA